jgi:branched-subunit amino acid aminotransferase/4-amino-4-deoxychorismate lyase
MTKGIAYVGEKRRFVPLRSAVVPVTDRIVSRGTGVFEVLRAYNRVPFELDAHLVRLQSSLKIGNLPQLQRSEFIKKKISEGLRRFNQDVFIKILFTGGEGQYLRREGPPRFFILFWPVSKPRHDEYEKGLKLATVVYSRYLHLGKFTDYSFACNAYEKAIKKGFDDVLYIDEKNYILEGTTFNFGIIKGGQLITPKDDVLQGITVATVLKLAPKLGLKSVRRPIKYSELRAASEAFVFSTLREIMPVAKVNNLKIGHGKPGNYYPQLFHLFKSYAENKTKKPRQRFKIS